MKRLLLGLAAAALIPMAQLPLAHAGPDVCLTNGESGAALQQCEQTLHNPQYLPAPKGPGACGLDSCPSPGNQQTHGEGICALTGACTPPR